MAYDVKFLKGTLANFEAQKTAATLDKNTFYYVDETDLYLGDILLSNDEDVKAAVARIKVNEDEIADIKAELDALVDPDGSGAGSITSQIAALRTELTNLIDTNYELIDAEKKRALAAEKTLQDNINATNTAIGEISTKVEKNETDITQLNTDLSSLTTKVNKNTDDLTIVKDDIYEMKPDVKTLKETSATHTFQLNTLIGTDTDKSVREIAIAELSNQLIPENAQEALNTLEEIAAWLQQHPKDVGEINQKINTNTQNIDTLLGTTSNHTDRIVDLEELVTNINDTNSGILATAKKYTDDEIDKVELVVDGISDIVSGHTDAINAINDKQTGILATANSNIQTAIANLGLGSAAYANITDFDAAGSAAAALTEAKGYADSILVEAKEYTDLALTWGDIK